MPPAPPEKKRDPRSWRGLTPPLAECESPAPFHHLRALY
ncbi:DEAD/DEAH box helicase [Colletotrichum graminicola]|nr:DEAD/DEAH box helicase [Colletotrichum graminicola]